MVRYELVCKFTCDLCGGKTAAFEGNKNWVKPPTLWDQIRRKKRTNTDICSECVQIIKEARLAHKDPLIDLVARKQREV